MKRAQLTLIFLLAGVPRLWADQAQDYYKIALDNYTRGNYSDSAVILEGVTRNKPDYWEAFETLGRDYASLGESPQAIAACEKSLALHPDNLALKDFLATLKNGTYTPPPRAVPATSGTTSGTQVVGAQATSTPTSVAANAPQGKQAGGFYIGLAGGADIPAQNWQSAYTVGPGGAVELAYRLDSQLELGLDVMGFYFSGTNFSGAITDAQIYLLPTLRFHFGGPYLLVSGGAEVEFLSGNPLNPVVDPELALGAGYEADLGGRTFLFLEGKGNVIFSPLATGIDVPVVAGLRAGL